MKQLQRAGKKHDVQATIAKAFATVKHDDSNTLWENEGSSFERLATYEAIDSKFRQFSAQYSQSVKWKNNDVISSSPARVVAQPRPLSGAPLDSFSTETVKVLTKRVKNIVEKTLDIKLKSPKHFETTKSPSLAANEMPLDSKFVQEFRISPAVVRRLPTEEERVHYVTNCVITTLRETYKTWNDKHVMRERGRGYFDTQLNEKRHLLIEKKNDQFQWLHLNTKYPSLTKRLRESLIQLIQEDDNKETIEAALTKQNLEIEENNTKNSALIGMKLRNSSLGNLSTTARSQGKPITQAQKVFLKSFASFDTCAILKELWEQKESLYAKNFSVESKDDFKIDLGDAEIEDRKRPLTRIVPEIPLEKLKKIKNGIEEKDRLRRLRAKTERAGNHQRRISMKDRAMEISEGNEGEDDIGKKVLDGEGTKLSQGNFEWMKDREDIFLDYRQDAKSRLSKQVRSSSWNNVGFSPLVQAWNLSTKSNRARDLKFRQFQEGSALNEEDLKHLVVTSTMLNSHLDHKFYQRAVDVLDNNILNTLEIKLAEGIIKSYQENQRTISSARREYLKECNKEKERAVQRKSQESLRRGEVKNGRQVQRQTLHNISAYLRKKDLTISTAEQVPSSASHRRGGPTSVSGNYLKIFIPEQHRTLSTSPQKKQIERELVKRSFHPPSKLYSRNLESPYHQTRLPIAERVDQLTQEIENFNKVTPLVPSVSKFTSFYSGGPREPYRKTNNHQILLQKQLPADNFTKKEIEAAIKIQAFIRRVLARKLWRIRLDERIYQEDEQRKKIRKLQTTKGLVMGVRLLSNKMSPPTAEYEKFKFEIAEGFTRALVSPFFEEGLKIQEGEATGEQKLGKPHVNLNLRSNSLQQAPELQPSYQITNETKEDELLKSLETPIRDFMKPQFFLHSTDTPKDVPPTLHPNPLTLPEFKLNSNKTSTMNTPQQSAPPQQLLKPQSHRPSIISNSRPQTSRGVGNAPRFEEMQKLTEIRAARIAQKKPPRGLLLKQRKLLYCAKHDNFDLYQRVGWSINETDTNVMDEDGFTPLYYTVWRRNLKFCQYLLDRGANPNAPCKNGNTPMHKAFETADDLVIMLLITRGGNLNTLNFRLQTPIAFGGRNILERLGLTEAIATVSNQKDRSKEFDNNKLLRVKPKITSNDLSLPIEAVKTEMSLMDNKFVNPVTIPEFPGQSNRVPSITPLPTESPRHSAANRSNIFTLACETHEIKLDHLGKDKYLARLYLAPTEPGTERDTPGNPEIDIEKLKETFKNVHLPLKVKSPTSSPKSLAKPMKV